jgi:hypothetical protein
MMFDHTRAPIALKRTLKFLTLLAITIPFTSSGNAADLRVPVAAKPPSEQPPPAEQRKPLVKQFLDWKQKTDSR